MSGLGLLQHSIPIASFAFVMSITPGPNNIMLLASGSRFGLRPTLPHMFGITFGFLAMLAMVFAGLGTLIVARPAVGTALAIACVVYLAWLAWQLLAAPTARGAVPDAVSVHARPIGFWAAAAFQFVNPKAWGMAVTAVGIVSSLPFSPLGQLAVLLVVCGLINVPCVLVWASFGAAISRFLHEPRVRLAFNVVMALLIAATAWWMLQPLLPELVVPS